MRDHDSTENSILELWKSQGTYEKLKRSLAGAKEFYFCDGPPYATGQIHPGTGWNKCIKDSVLRYRRLKGYNAFAKPGYDTHGLPIEVKVEQKLELKLKKDIEEKIGVENFVKECKEFATKYIGIMNNDFSRLGVWLDYSSPYITYKDSYIEKTWAALKEVWDRKLMYESVYSLTNCPRCETTLANYELEYGEKKSQSVYVKFRLSGKENEYLLIWTTTPWTLVANMAVMANPMLDYVKIDVGGEKWILAEQLVEKITKLAGVENVIIEEKFAGKKLDKLEYEHPLQDLIGKTCSRRVVMSDEYVTVIDGTGLVHTAPGHGPEDFIIGKRYGIEIYCPVDEKGRYDLTAGKYFGMNVLEVNDTITRDLKEKGALIAKQQVMHRYPHCWRCKTPLIYITSKQWFIRITEIKEKMLGQIEMVNWHPDFAKTRFRDFVSNAPDWCISRQRYWGIPLPIWRCSKGHSVFIGSRAELGVKIKELHRPFIDSVKLKCKDCGEEMKRIPDILDVWFDSGNAVWAGMGSESHVADFIVEGKDQTRGWFYSLLGMGVSYKGVAPYRNVLMHGFFVDQKGEKMSKSVGNYVPLEEILKKHGSDAFRLWSLGSTLWDDLKFSWDDMANANRAIEIIYNMHIYLSRFYSGDDKLSIDKSTLAKEDRWILSRMNSLIKEVDSSFDCYEIHKAVQQLRYFLVEELSRTYLKLVKDRFEQKDPAVAAIFYKSLLDSLILAHPVVPFITEHIYQEFYRKFEQKDSIVFLDYPTLKEGYVDKELEQKMFIALDVKTAVINLRNKNSINVRQPLSEVLILPANSFAADAIQELKDIILRFANVKELAMVQDAGLDVAVELNRNAFGRVFKADSAEAMKAVSALKPSEILSTLLSKGFIEHREQKLGFDFFDVQVSRKGYAAVVIPSGVVLVNTTIDSKLLLEGTENELIRRVQDMRKQLGLVEADLISFSVKGISEKINWSRVESAVNGKQVSSLKGGTTKQWEIKDSSVEIAVKKK